MRETSHHHYHHHIPYNPVVVTTPRTSYAVHQVPAAPAAGSYAPPLSPTVAPESPPASPYGAPVQPDDSYGPPLPSSIANVPPAEAIASADNTRPPSFGVYQAAGKSVDRQRLAGFKALEAMLDRYVVFRTLTGI